MREQAGEGQGHKTEGKHGPGGGLGGVHGGQGGEEALGIVDVVIVRAPVDREIKDIAGGEVEGGGVSGDGPISADSSASANRQFSRARASLQPHLIAPLRLQYCPK